MWSILQFIDRCDRLLVRRSQSCLAVSPHHVFVSVFLSVFDLHLYLYLRVLSNNQLTTRQDEPANGWWSVGFGSQADLHPVKTIHKCLIFIRYLPTFLQFNLDTREVESDTYFIDLTYISELILNLQKLG